VTGEAKWNIGARAYDIYVGDEKVASGVVNKDLAYAMATGKAPLPVAA
jgi:hypothetical protein